MPAFKQRSCRIRNKFSEQNVIDPVRTCTANRLNRNIVHEPHDQNKNRQRKDSVRYHHIDIVRCRHDKVFFVDDAHVNDASDEVVTSIGNDAPGLVAKNFFSGFDKFFDFAATRRIKRDVFPNVIIVLKELDCIKAQIFIRHDSSKLIFNHGQSRFKAIVILRKRIFFLLFFNHHIDQHIQISLLQSTDSDYRHAQQILHLLQVDAFALLFEQVHHVDCTDYRKSGFHQLQCQIQISLQIRSVDHVDDYVRTSINQISSGNDFFRTVWRQRIDARKILNDDTLVFF